MQLLDVNVVLAHHRRDHVHHALARAHVDAVLDASEPFTVPLPVWGSFLRLVTSPRVLLAPTPRPDAFAYANSVRAWSNHVDTGPGGRHLGHLQRLCDEGGASAELVADAVVAAIAAEHDCEIVTFDRDFRRFPSVRARILA